MPSSYVVSLVLLVAAAVALRLLLAARVGARGSGRANRWDMLLVLLGWLGLTLHCGAMFYRSTVEAIPGTDALVQAVNALGTASVVAFVVPAALVVVGLRRARPLLVVGVFAALTAVGVTMYNGASLEVHLTTIVAAAVLLAFTSVDLFAGGSTDRRRSTLPAT